MKHLLNFSRDSAGDFLVVSVTSDEFFAFFATKVTHVWAATQDLTGTGNFEAFHDNFSGLLLYFFHIDLFFGLYLCNK